VLLGVSLAWAFDEMEGLAFFDPTGPGFDMAFGQIMDAHHVWVKNEARAFIGLDNQRSGDDLIKANAGWSQEWSDYDSVRTWSTYYSYRDERGGTAWVVTSNDVPDNTYYGVYREGANMVFYVDGGSYTLPWSDFDRCALCSAQFTSWVRASPHDWTPGLYGDPCHFNVCRVRPPGGTSYYAPFTQLGSNSNIVHFDEHDYGGLQVISDGNFKLWDTRSEP
jgi:hypothetical protein